MKLSQKAQLVLIEKGLGGIVGQVKWWWDKQMGFDYSFSRLIPEDICITLDRLGITKIDELYEGSQGLGLRLTFDKGNNYVLVPSSKLGEPFVFSIKRMIRIDDVSWASGWKVYLTRFARGYTPEQIIDAMREELPSFEETIMVYRTDRADRMSQMVKAQTAWAKAHRDIAED